MPEVLNTDNPSREGNLTAEEYQATYTEPGTTGGHEIPADVIAKALADIEARNG